MLNVSSVEFDIAWFMFLTGCNLMMGIDAYFTDSKSSSIKYFVLMIACVLIAFKSKF